MGNFLTRTENKTGAMPQFRGKAPGAFSLLGFLGRTFQRNHFHRFALTHAKRIHADEAEPARLRLRFRWGRSTLGVVRAIAHRKGNQGVRADQAAEGLDFLRTLSRTHGSPNAAGAQRHTPLPSK